MLGPHCDVTGMMVWIVLFRLLPGRKNGRWAELFRLVMLLYMLPSGKRTVCDGKSPSLIL